MSAVLVRPTVAMLINALKAFPRDMPVIIEDADTEWTIDQIHIGTSGKYGPQANEPERLILWGEYSEMSK